MVLLVFACSSVLQQAEKLESSCDLLKKMIIGQKKARQEVDDFKCLIRKIPPQFSAAGFFQITKSTLVSIANTVTMYFIVVLQLNQP